jgi:hypothetical protein
MENLANGKMAVTKNSLEQLNLLMQMEKNSDKDAQRITRLKSYTEAITDKVVASAKLPDDNSMMFGDNMYAGQIFKSNSDLISRENAIAHNLPIYNLTECENRLREVYNLTSDSEFVYATSMTDGHFNTITQPHMV